MYKERNNDMILCPYNRYHVVSILRIQKHIAKCQKNYPNIKLATCFYNYTHRVKPEDMLKHYEICSHKTRVDGARYYEPGTYNPIDSSLNSDDQSFSFPKTAVRTHEHFYNPCKPSSEGSKAVFKYGEEDFESPSSSDDPSLDINKASLPKTDYVGSDDDDSDDMKPLPLPKTVSKAFTCIKHRPEKCSTNSRPCEAYQTRGFGRARNILRFSTSRPQKISDRLLPNVSTRGIILSEKKIPKSFPTSNTSSRGSIVSSVFDDNARLKSQDTDGEDFIAKNLEKYLKI